VGQSPLSVVWGLFPDGGGPSGCLAENEEEILY
jgi:hypothetical protein